MREILFRGKRVDNGEWVEGDLLNNNLIMTWHDGELSATGETRSDGQKFYEGSFFQIDPSTVGQYTGIKDKNGKKIFEGDVVFATCGEHYQGVWEFSKYYVAKIAWPQEMYEMLLADELEVIGNIHDNPELIVDEQC